ncbi:MAG: tetratricopeptide repeat protein [Gemmataceae bacterium]|nr:tetratricopeptide repeat protein [Gemmataceae bacterium]
MKSIRKTINVKFAAIVVGVFAILAAGAHLLHGYQVKRNARILFDQAQKAEERGDLARAIDYVRRYRGLAPHDDEALAKLGMLLADPAIAKTRKQALQAYFVLEQALRRQPGRDDLRRRVVILATHPLLERPADALEHLARLPVDGDKELLGLRGRCHELLGEYRQARASYQAALRLPDPAAHDFLRLAYLLRRQASAVQEKAEFEDSIGDVHAKADAVIAALLKAHGESFKAHLASAQYFREFVARTDPRKGQALVEAHLKQAWRLAPDEADVQLAWAELAQDKGEHDEARAVLQRGMQKHPTEWRMYQGLARLEMHCERPEAALTALRSGVDKLPQQMDLQWSLAHLLTHLGHFDDADAAIARLAREGLRQTELDYLQGRLHAAKEQWLPAARLLERAHPHLLTRADQHRDGLAINLLVECNLVLARCYESLGDADRSVAAFGRVVTRAPQSVAGRLGLARMEWALGRLDNALREYGTLRQYAKPPTAAWTEAIQLMILRNLQRAQPSWVEVDHLLKEAEQLKPLPVEVGLLRAEFLVAQQQFDKARTFLEQAHANKQERPVEVWVGLANLEQRGGRADAALALLKEAEQVCGDLMELREARCRYWARRGGAEAPRALDQLGQGLEKFSRARQRRFWPTLADSYVQVGEAKRAELVWKQVAQRQPNDLGSRLAMFDLALRGQSDVLPAELVQEIKAIEGEDGSLWRFCHAQQLIAQAQKSRDTTELHQATEHLATVASRRTSWGRVPVAQGQVNELLGNFDGAIAKYREAIMLGVENPAVIRRVTQLLWTRGRFLEAEEMIQKLRGMGGTLRDLDRMEAEIALWKEDPIRALSLAEKAIPADSKDYRDHVWLGQIQWAAGKNREAEAELRRAVQLAPDIPDTWVPLVLHHARTGAKDKAKQAIAEARKALPKESARLALAQCFDAIGETDQAKQHYLEALAATPNDSTVLKNVAYFYLRRNDTREAKTYLSRLVQLKGLPPQQLAEAKRALALVLASAGDYQQTVKALEQFGVVDGGSEKVAAMATERIADQRAQILILSVAQNPRQRRKGVTLLEDLMRRQQMSRDDRFLLAQLYDTVGEWPKAREQYLFLLTLTQDAFANATRNKPALQTEFANQLAAYCNALVRHDDLAQFNHWLPRLEELEPNNVRTIGLRAQLLAKQGRAEKGANNLMALAAKQDQLAGPVAVLLERIGQLKPAEDMFKRYVSQSPRPEAALALAEFYGRQHRPQDAFAVCQGALKTCRIEQVGASAVFVLYATRCNAEQQRQVAGWLQAGLTAKSNATALMTQLAAVRRLQSDHAAVIALYRKALEHDPNDTLTLNNLAWLLALKDQNASEALSLIQRAIELDGPQSEYLDTRAVAYLTLGDAENAVKDLDEAIAETPTAHRYFHLAQAHQLAQRGTAAAHALQRAKDLGLSEATVDPLELPAYRQIMNDQPAKSASVR